VGGAAQNVAEVTNAITNAMRRVRRNRPERTVFFIVVRPFGDSWTLKQTAPRTMVKTERKLHNAAGVVDVRSTDDLQVFRVMKKH